MLLSDEHLDRMAQLDSSLNLTHSTPATDTRAGEEGIRLQFDADKFAAEDLARIRQLTVGGWIEVTDTSGTAQSAKLSWISPISQRLLFVNRRGLRLRALSLGFRVRNSFWKAPWTDFPHSPLGPSGPSP